MNVMEKESVLMENVYVIVDGKAKIVQRKLAKMHALVMVYVIKKH